MNLIGLIVNTYIVYDESKYFSKGLALIQLIRHQISLFFPEAFFGNLQGILMYLLENAGGTLNNQPIILPIPENAPEEIPRIILRSSDNSQELLLKTNRIDIAIARPFEKSISESERVEFEKNATHWLLPLIDNGQIRVNRVGVVMQRAFLPEGISPGAFISAKYCKDEFLEQPFGNAKNFEINCLKNYNFLNSMINSWVRIQTLNILPSKKQVVGVLNDLNQVPSSTLRSSEEVANFISNTNTEAEKILSLYKIEVKYE